MRKLKGYIGALIVVMALMGSILAGYALNVNGREEVINGYENVTDVSGLYEHTQEKTYIEYNPASNYIGYGSSVYSNTAQNESYTYRNITNGVLYFAKGAGLTYVGEEEVYYWPSTGILPWPVIGEGFFIYGALNDPIIYGRGFSFVHYDRLLMSVELPNVYIQIDNEPGAYITGVNYLFSYDPINYNYVGSNSDQTGINRNIVINNPNQTYGVAVSDTLGWGTFNNTSWISMDGNAGTIQPITLVGNAGNGTSIYTVNSSVSGYGRIATIYPKNIQSTVVGIDYTESTRVNNYPMGFETRPIEGQTNVNVNLYNTDLTNYYSGGRYNLGSVPHGSNGSYTWSGYLYSSGSGLVKMYKLQDILNTLTIPENTTQFVIETGKNLVNVNADVGLGTFSNVAKVAQNTATINAETGNAIKNYSNRQLIDSDGIKAYYTPSTGIVEAYNYSGVKLYTSDISRVYVTFFNEGAGDYNNDGLADLYVPVGGDNYRGNWYYPTAPQAFLDITMITNGSVEIGHYMDISKGVSIKTNAGVTRWDNEYENGVINILFRAETNYNTYHNTIKVASNTVDIDYNGGRFSVTLNGGEPVDIGTWRNIVLNIDMIDGEINAIPVRTFNSYTNVALDNTSIPIGSIAEETTNFIDWLSTTNSLKFVVYNTEVFLDTYGIVMINPSLNIVNYFPNLDNFYRLKLGNFSVLGDSMTINGKTGTVSGNTIDFEGQSLMLRDLAVTYANGKVSVGDGNIDIDLGELTDTNIVAEGVWYFVTNLQKGFTETKMVYNWDWQDFILDNTQFCVFYIGLALAGLIIARRFCSMNTIDYAVFVVSIVIALTTQVIA